MREPIEKSNVAVAYAVITTLLVQSLHFSFFALLPIFTMSPFQMAYADTTNRLSTIKSKYDTANPNNNFKDNKLLNKTLEKYKNQRQKPSIEGKLISKYYGTPQRTSVVDLSKYPNTSAGFSESYQNSVNIARSISSNVQVPKSNASGDLNIKYNPEGVVLTKDENGNFISTYDTDGIVDNKIAKDEYTSSEITHSKTSFKAGDNYGDEEQFYSDAKTKVNSLSTSTASDGLVFQMLRDAKESNPAPEINQRDPMFDYGFEAVDKANKGLGNVFGACADNKVDRVENVHYSEWENHNCAAVNKANKNYCEVERNYISTQIIENYEGDGKIEQCGDNCLEIEFGELGVKTKRGGQCWDVNYNANLNLSDHVKISKVDMNYRIEDHAKLSVNGSDVWSNIKGVQGNGGMLPNKGDGCLARPTWSGTDKGNLLPKLKEVINGVSNQANLNFTVRYGEEGEGHMKIRMYFTALDDGELGMRFNQSPEGCYDELTSEEKTENPLNLNRITLPTNFTSVVNVATQGRDVLTADFDLAQGVITWNEALNDSPIGSRIAEIEPVNYDLVCAGIPPDITASVNQWTGYNLPGSFDDTATFIMTRAPTCANGLVGQLQARDTRSDNDIEFTLGITATFNFDYGTTAIVEPPSGETVSSGFCTFDDYQILEANSDGFSESALSFIPFWFANDDGNKTWKVNLKGYNCDPLKGNKHSVTNAAGETEEYSFDELKNLPSQCDIYTNDDTCIEIDRTCGEGWEVDGECLISTVEYKCDVGSTYEITTEETVNACADTIPCIDGDCEYGERESNDQFVEAMAVASTLQHMEDDMECDDPNDLTTCRIFNGDGKFCSWELSGLGTDCCESPGGIDIFQYAQAAQALMQADAYVAGLEGSANAAVNSYQALREPIADGITSAWETVSQPITDALTSSAGTAAGEVATSEGIKGAAEEGVMDQLGQSAMNFVAENLPADLSQALFTKQVEGEATDYVLSEGASQAVSILGYVYGAYVIYQYVKLALELLTACDEFEGDMGIRLETKQCIAVAEPYCHDKFLGTCLVRRRDYCCYGSILARIIMEQASPMVGHDLEQYSGETIDESGIRSCPGLTPEQLSNLDFSQINLDEWTNIMLQSGIIDNENTESSLTGSGRMINSGIRETTTDRTKGRLAGANLADHAINAKKQITIENLDCSIIPRPSACFIND